MGETIYPVPSAWAADALVDDAAYRAMYRQSVEQPDAFWRDQAKCIDWMRPFTRVKETSFDEGDFGIAWFSDGTLNLSANALDRHLAERGDAIAILWEPDDPADAHRAISYRELHADVCRFANLLKAQGVRRGERVTIYLPMVPEAAVAMLACTRIGAIHSIVFAGFSPDALAGRITDCDSRIVLTADEGLRGGKHVPLKANVDEALAHCPGVERVADEVSLRFPEARTAIVTSDTLWSPAKAAEFVEAVEDGLVDIIIGTQLVTKGYHFPNLTLVGVVDADLGLDGGDLRAAERTFQQIAQVAGRAGRGVKPGEVLIQTRVPDAPVMAALVANDREGFYAAEAAARKFAGAPPYGRFAALVISSEDIEVARGVAQRLGEKPPVADGLAIYGPAPAPLAMLRGRHRFRLLLHAPRSFDLQGAIRDWISRIDWPTKVRLAIDIDPYSFV